MPSPLPGRTAALAAVIVLALGCGQDPVPGAESPAASEQPDPKANRAQRERGPQNGAGPRRRSGVDGEAAFGKGFFGTINLFAPIDKRLRQAVLAGETSLEQLAMIEEMSYERELAIRRQAARKDPTLLNRLVLGDMYLALGQADQAVTVLERASKAFPESDRALRALALGYLRQGTEANCLTHGTSSMCLYPVNRGAQDAGDGEGMTHMGMAYEVGPALASLRTYLRLLERTPMDMHVRWLANIVAQEAGVWPDGLPKKYRWDIPEPEPSEPFPVFSERGAQAGVASLSTTGGVIFDDLTGDGRPDIMWSGHNLSDSLRLFRNVDGSTFEDISVWAGLNEARGGFNITQADVDNDGDLDVYQARSGWAAQMPDSLMINDGQGRFTDNAAEAGLDRREGTFSVDFADYDLDGWVDLYRWGFPAGPSSEASNRLLRNQGDGTFLDVTDDTGTGYKGLVVGAALADVDGDMYPDLWLAPLVDGSAMLRKNEGGVSFRDVTEEAGLIPVDRGFTTWVLDYNQDGHQDIYLGTFYAQMTLQLRGLSGYPTKDAHPALFRNNGDGTFKEVAFESGLDRALSTMGCNYADLDNNSFPDLYIGTGFPSFEGMIPNALYANHGGQFEDVTMHANVAQLQKGHGVGMADVDGDGDLDIAQNLGGAYVGDSFPNTLLISQGTDNHWVRLHLVGTDSNRAAIGARIRVETDTGRAYETVTAGGSFGSRDLDTQIGLGIATRIERIQIRWPFKDGAAQVIEDVPIDTHIEVVENEDGYRILSP